MDMTRKQRRLQLALEERAERKKLVHSKLGWLAVGMTSVTLAALGFTVVDNGQLVCAAANESAKTSQVAPSPTVWTLRPVSEIKAQFQASDKKVYDIKWGDTLSTISEALNESGFTTSVDRLAEINHIANVDLIYAGAKLYLQGSGENATVTTKDSNGNNQTYNLNPAKPAVATPSDKAAAQAATPAKSNGSDLGKVTVAPDQAQEHTSTPSQTSTPSKPAEPSTPTTPSQPSLPHKNTNKSVTKNVDESGKDLGEHVSLKDYHQLSSTAKTVVTTSPNGDTVTTTASTVTYHKIVRTAKHVTKNVDKDGNALSTTDGYTLSKSSSKSVDTVAKNGDVTITITTTNVYTKSPVAQKATVTVKYVDAATGASIKPTEDSSKTVGDTFTASAPDISGYTLQGEKSQSVKVSASGNTITFRYKKDAATHDTDQYVTKNVDEDGNDLGQAPDTAKYHKLSKSKPAKTNVQTLPNGDTVTTYTTTVTYHKIAHTTKVVTKNVDEDGKALPDKVDTSAYKQLRSSDKVTTTTADNGDTTTTTTTTVVWHKLVNTNNQVTKNVDENGNDLGQAPDTTKYHKLTTSAPVKSVTTAANGDTVTTYTTTVTYHKIMHTTKHVTKNVDEDGNALSTTDGYDLVKSSDSSSDSVAQNGDVTTTITTTNVYKKRAVTPTTAKVTVVAKDTDGNVLKTTSTDATIGENYTAMAPEIDGYDLQGNNSQTVKVSADGNTITFTYKKHVEVPTTAKVTVVAKDTDGNTLKTTSADATVGQAYTAKAPSIDGYDLQGADSQTVTVSANGNTITFTYKKQAVAVDVNAVANRLVQLVNNWRTQNGLAALKSDTNLQAGATVRAQQEADAVKTGGMNAADHNLPDGRSFNYEAHLQQYGSTSMAENLLITNGSTVETIAQNAFNQWKNSAGHNANMLGQYTDEGLSVIALPSGGYLALQDFGYKVPDTWNQAKFNSKSLVEAGFTPSELEQADLTQGFDWAGRQRPRYYYIPQYVFKSISDTEAYLDFTSRQEKSLESASVSQTFVKIYLNGTYRGTSVVLQTSEPVSSLQSQGYKPGAMTIPAVPTTVKIRYVFLDKNLRDTVDEKEETVPATAGQVMKFSSKQFSGFTAYDNGLHPLTVNFVPVAEPTDNEVQFWYVKND